MHQEHSLFPEHFYTELKKELQSITDYWITYSVDEKRSGFVGQRDHENNLVPEANKGIILNTRILWSFSAIAKFSGDTKALQLATRAFNYLYDFSRDKKYGGVYWELNAEGIPVNRKKQVYAQAFAIYGLSQYYLITQEETAKTWAISIFELLEKHAFDRENEGYIEAFQEDWSVVEDMRLSEKDQNAEKTMNTHLHVLEAYTLFYTIYPDAKVKKSLENLINLFLDRFLTKNGHFHLFFDKKWQLLSSTISYGHDIEAAWLLIEAAKVTENGELLQKTEKIALIVAKTFLKEGYIRGNGVLNELDQTSGRLDTDRHWWPQTEAMVGLLYAYKINPDEIYKSAIIDIWDFTKTHIIDHKNGEWFFRIDENNQAYTSEDKLGMWKCPYHNSRALISLLDRF
ncbi:AGE family epimerase/isomerase [Flavimarina sp. Hel_I_48]|uniref:AGE family epimerase/isomerase n=1 Tax=Flavimarina sp. Hel_I_48 TaxID=1392488 RepID=UPI00068DA015|nr:AGE family epimerase/isomerase [Flavimarina sp. Hel_I_48]